MQKDYIGTEKCGSDTPKNTGETLYLGSTSSELEAVPGSIRGDFALTIGENIVHGSDSPEAAEREINNFFSAEEIY